MPQSVDAFTSSKATFVCSELNSGCLRSRQQRRIRLKCTPGLGASNFSRHLGTRRRMAEKGNGGAVESQRMENAQGHGEADKPAAPGAVKSTPQDSRQTTRRYPIRERRQPRRYQP
ncbi:uncharacterized protein [Dermacentor albipictus]|uniref:uncharacterized protein isoform X2 n=1 Tax=Dermacentor albipictus TaxID=60249 RepID=UPI0038FD13CA